MTSADVMRIKYLITSALYEKVKQLMREMRREKGKTDQIRV